MDTLSFINPYWPNIPCLYSLKTSEILWFSDFLKGIEMEHWANMDQLLVVNNGNKAGISS